MRFKFLKNFIILIFLFLSVSGCNLIPPAEAVKWLNINPNVSSIILKWEEPKNDNFSNVKIIVNIDDIDIEREFIIPKGNEKIYIDTSLPYLSHTVQVISVYNNQEEYKHLKKTIQPLINYRIGAVCNDGTSSSATGSGACSWHGGVKYWRYRYNKPNLDDGYYRLYYP